MARTINAATQSALTASEVMPVYLFKAEFDEGTVYLWSGLGNLTWDSQTWTGTGTFGSVSDIEETTNVQANGVKVSLTGIPSEIIAIALNYEYRNRPCHVYLGAVSLADPNTLVGDPLVEVGGRMDVMSIEDSASIGSVIISIENRLIDLARARERRFTNEDQQVEYPNDRGLEYVAGLQDKSVSWGIAEPPSTSRSSGGTGTIGGPVAYQEYYTGGS
tara:strand:- start:26 stop:679 length:654 start_codon:yes stop_codon:yes gene_type:complete